jgi:hypothetical protein
MLGIVGSLLGSVASGVMGLMGQQSANDTSIELSKNRYQYASADMQAAWIWNWESSNQANWFR